MENESKNILIDKARSWCDWQTFDDDKKGWYLKKVARLLLDDKDVLQLMFKDQLN
jgi:hypothetical protein